MIADDDQGSEAETRRHLCPAVSVSDDDSKINVSPSVRVPAPDNSDPLLSPDIPRPSTKEAAEERRVQ